MNTSMTYEKIAQLLAQQQVEPLVDSLLLDLPACWEQMGGGHPAAVDLWIQIATWLVNHGRMAKAEAWCRWCLQEFEHPELYHCLGLVCRCDTERAGEALTWSQRAYEANSQDVRYCSFYGFDLIQTGQMTDGLACLEQARNLAPDQSQITSNYLWYLHYFPEKTRQDFLATHRAWAQTFAPVTRARTQHANTAEPHRRLRIGYVSPDFRQHSMMVAFEPLLDGHNRDDVALYAYANVPQSDATTERLAKRFDYFCNIAHLNDAQAATQIADDKVDILVAFGGLCAGHRLGILAYKPAPIQVDLGAISTTGMPQIDYRIIDDVLDPPDSQQWISEKLMYLPSGLPVYRPPQTSPVIPDLPAQSNGYVTFGSFNNHVKISPMILELWARVLVAVPQSRLMMKFMGGGDRTIQEHFIQRFAEHGVTRERLQCEGRLSHYEHLELMTQVDIVLDTYPFNGNLTTLEGLWMGIPPVTLVGETNVARSGLNILKRIGLEIFAAHTPDEFVAKATAFAHQPESLAQIRAGLRQTLLHSPLCNPKRLAGEVESLYRQMWHRWCEQQGVAVVPCTKDIGGGKLKQKHTSVENENPELPENAASHAAQARDYLRNDATLVQAVHHAQQAVTLEPEEAAYHRDLGLALMRMGRMVEGAEALTQAVELAPDNPDYALILSGWSHYLPQATELELVRGPCAWAKRRMPVEKARKRHTNTPDPQRRLRIGYIGPDFRDHVVMKSVGTIFDHHDPQNVDVFIYSHVPQPDDVTRRLQGQVSRYRDIVHISDMDVAHLVVQDQIDILVALAGHCQNNRLGVLAYKPAPIQMEYGCIGTTGMPQVDYRLTDELLDPSDVTRAYVEKSLNLPGGLVIFTPPQVETIAERNEGPVTFGSFNNNLKINDVVLDLWTEILQALPDCRLLMKCQALANEEGHTYYQHQFRQRGIDPSRLDLIGRVAAPEEHYRIMGSVDVILDTYPYNGCLTTCEALWMGVPVVTLSGERFVSRVGLTILKRIGLDDYCTTSTEDYIDRAVQLAHDYEQRQQWRQTLRQRMLNSLLCDGERFAREMEALYRQVWQRWCQVQKRTQSLIEQRRLHVKQQRRQCVREGS